MKKFITFAFLGSVLTASSALAATIVTYTDSSLFNSSTIVGGSPTFTEQFNNNTPLFTTFEIPGAAGLTPGFIGDQRSTRVTPSYTEVVSLSNLGSMTAF